MGNGSSKDKEEVNKANVAKGDQVNEEGGLHIETHEMVGGSTLLMLLCMLGVCWYLVRRQLAKQRKTRRRLLALCGSDLHFPDDGRFARAMPPPLSPPPYPGYATQMMTYLPAGATQTHAVAPQPQPFPPQPYRTQALDPMTVAATVAALSGRSNPSLVVDERELPDFVDKLMGGSNHFRGGKGERERDRSDGYTRGDQI